MSSFYVEMVKDAVDEFIVGTAEYFRRALDGWLLKEFKLGFPPEYDWGSREILYLTMASDLLINGKSEITVVLEKQDHRKYRKKATPKFHAKMLIDFGQGYLRKKVRQVTAVVEDTYIFPFGQEQQPYEDIYAFAQEHRTPYILLYDVEHDGTVDFDFRDAYDLTKPHHSHVKAKVFALCPSGNVYSHLNTHYQDVIKSELSDFGSNTERLTRGYWPISIVLDDEPTL